MIPGQVHGSNLPLIVKGCSRYRLFSFPSCLEETSNFMYTLYIIYDSLDTQWNYNFVLQKLLAKLAMILLFIY